MKYVLLLQLLFFFLAGTQIVLHEKKVARTEAYSEILITLPMQELGEQQI